MATEGEGGGCAEGCEAVLEEVGEEEMCLGLLVMEDEGYRRRAYSNGKLEAGKGNISSLGHLGFHAQDDAFVQQHGEWIEVQRNAERCRHRFLLQNVLDVVPRQ